MPSFSKICAIFFEKCEHRTKNEMTKVSECETNTAIIEIGTW
jgi:hypothetical protein